MRGATVVLWWVLAFPACTNSTEPERQPDQAITVWIRYTGLILSPRDTFQTGVTAYDDSTHALIDFPDDFPDDPNLEGLTVTWQSSAPDVVRVGQNGLLKGSQEGSATIRVDIEGQRDSSTVKVRSTSPSTMAFTTVSTGGFSTCALDGEQRAWCWGSDWHGALGRGTARTFTSAATRGLVVGGHRFSSVDAGGQTACGITTSGETYCWGENTTGKLGNGTDGLTGPYLSGSAEPEHVMGDPGFNEVSVGQWHVCGIAAGMVYCWGNDGFGETGTGTWSFDHVTEPAKISSDLQFTTVSAGFQHTCAITTDNRAFCWGSNVDGQLGAPTTERCASGWACSTVPVEVAGGLRFEEIAVGAMFTCGLTTGHETYCWGSNSDGQAGQDNGDVYNIPVVLAEAPQFEHLTAGAMHACGLTGSGSAYCWGEGVHGQLGNGEQDVVGNPVPRPVSGGLAFAAISGEGRHTCGLASDGLIYCWGWNPYGQVGDGTFRHDRVVPARVVDP